MNIAELEAKVRETEQLTGSLSPELLPLLQELATSLRRDKRLLEAVNIEAKIKVIKGTLPTSTDAQHDEKPQDKVCPFCAETIKAEAALCRYCHMDLSDPAAQSGSRACPNCHQLVKQDAVLCKFCRSPIARGAGAATGVPSTSQELGIGLGVGSLLISFFAGYGAPYYAAVLLVPIALTLAIVSLAMKGGVFGISGLLYAIYMAFVLFLHQLRISS